LGGAIAEVRRKLVSYQLEGKTVFVAGHRGMVGSALIRRLATERCEVRTADRDRVDLRNQLAVHEWFSENRPHAVFVAAGKVGGISANNLLRAEFIYDNIMIATNLVHASHLFGVQKLMFLGSSCIYPRLASQPMSEESMLTGPLEPTNEPYAIAKIAGVKLVESYRRQYGCDYVSVMPTNLYGQGDNYHPEYSHVVAALIQRIHDAKVSGAGEVIVWGTGTPRREFMFVDDMADACIFLMKAYSNGSPINIGTGEDISIADFAKTVAAIVGFEGKIVFDSSRPDGTPRKLMDVGRLTKLGWSSTTPLRRGIELTYEAYLRTLK
jgi:GDP-L-fucose synthase